MPILGSAANGLRGRNPYNAASGGTVTTVTNYNGTGQTWKVHTFTTAGTLTVTKATATFKALIVGGGGNGGGGSHADRGGGGGGGGGVLEDNAKVLTVQGYTITPGAAHANTTAFGLTAYKGGNGGATAGSAVAGEGGATVGGSGGGSSWFGGGSTSSSTQGGDGQAGAEYSGGGGGFGGAGSDGSSPGTQFTSDISGTVTNYAGRGGGGYNTGGAAATQRGGGGGGGNNTGGGAGMAGTVIVAYRIA